MIGVTVDVHSLVIGWPSGPIHIVVLPLHSPASLASSCCILPGVPASMQAFLSSMVQPGGNLISACPAGAVSFLASAIEMETTIAAIATAATNAGTTSFLWLMMTSMN